MRKKQSVKEYNWSIVFATKLARNWAGLSRSLKLQTMKRKRRRKSQFHKEKNRTKNLNKKRNNRNSLPLYIDSK